MLIACWSAKGGSGTTVVAAALALLTARASVDGALLADLGGDVPAALGVPERTGPGLAAWLAADDDVGADALARLAIPIVPGCTSWPRAPQWPVHDQAGAQRWRRRSPPTTGTVIVDAGSSPTGAALDVAGGAAVSLLVVRPCFLALRRGRRRPGAAVGHRARARSGAGPHPARRGGGAPGARAG